MVFVCWTNGQQMASAHCPTYLIIFFYTIFSYFYYAVFNIIQNQIWQCYFDATTAYFLKYSGFRKNHRVENLKNSVAKRFVLVAIGYYSSREF